MLPRFADIFQQGNRWLNWLEKQPEGSVRPVVTVPHSGQYKDTSLKSIPTQTIPV